MKSEAPADTAGMRQANDDIGVDKRLDLFRLQVEIRDCEKRAYDLFMQNLIKGTSHLSLGQEAIAAAFGVAMQKNDKSFCTYRGHAHTLARGVGMEKMLGELMLRDIGLMRGKGGSMHLTSVEHGVMGSYAIIGAHLPIACGAAWRAQYLGEPDVSVCFFGDGTTNIGAFHEALNFAAVWKLPVVFVCENNLYGEYTRIQLSTPVEDIAVRAASYNMPGVIVDGQDADKVAEAMAEAVARARRGDGPTLVEMKTYRYSGHSRSDPATYRPAGELDAWLKRDPIDIFAARMVQENLLAADGLDKLKADVREAVELATAEVLESPGPELGEIMAHVGAYSAGGDQRWNFWSK